jgi:hypothetical protein
LTAAGAWSWFMNEELCQPGHARTGQTFVRSMLDTATMGRTGYADLPLHGGRAPRWLFERMTALARGMAIAILTDEGAGGLLRRLADPVWF